MHKTLTVLLITLLFHVSAQSKKDYLRSNRLDLRSEGFVFPETSFRLIGYGAYHGSVKTEAAEHELLESLTQEGKLRYYLPETDFSTAYFFNQYLISGDTMLLKDLVLHYGVRVPQEKSRETFEKWKHLKKLNDRLDPENRLTVIGIDKIASYKYTVLHLLELLDLKTAPNCVNQLALLRQNDTTNYSAFQDSESKETLKVLVSNYLQNPSLFEISDSVTFQHIITNLQKTFHNSSKREETIYQNYVNLSPVYHFDTQPQFVRFGFFHLEKSREGINGYPSFFARLIEHGIYQKHEVISIIGYFTNSRVLWETQYDENGHYAGFSTEGGYGIGDYWKEYFRGIQKLKRSKTSDMTLFRLNQFESPYRLEKPDLMEIKLFLKKSNGKALKGMSTLDFLDYAILISDSEANTPLEKNLE